MNKILYILESSMQIHFTPYLLTSHANREMKNDNYCRSFLVYCHALFIQIVCCIKEDKKTTIAFSQYDQYGHTLARKPLLWGHETICLLPINPVSLHTLLADDN